MVVGNQFEIEKVHLVYMYTMVRSNTLTIKLYVDSAFVELVFYGKGQHSIFSLSVTRLYEDSQKCSSTVFQLETSVAVFSVMSHVF